MKAFPKWFRLLGWIIYPAHLIFVGRLLYEKTYLTWRYGPQNIGFTIVHTYPDDFLAGVIAFYFFKLWLLIALGLILWSRVRIAKLDWIQFGIIGLTVAIDYIPTEVWQSTLKMLIGLGK